MKRCDESEAAFLRARIASDLARLAQLETDPDPEPASEQFLAPCDLAYRLGLGENYIRRLCRRGHAEGIAGIRREGGRWLATIEAIEKVRPL